MKITPMPFLLAALLSGTAFAQAPSSPPAEERAAAPMEPIYGYQLMTPAEQAEYRARMRTLATLQEREAFRAEHHKLMQERARARGVTLPDAPPQRRMHQRAGQGMQQGPRVGQGAQPPGTTVPPK